MRPSLRILGDEAVRPLGDKARCGSYESLKQCSSGGVNGYASTSEPRKPATACMALDQTHDLLRDNKSNALDYS